jgi:8-oxo-dGTP pyrophosphatase MutT (NUDIX family)
MPLTSCGVLVTDGELLLIGQAAASPRWDIPKGIAEPGEAWPDAAARELQEETGLLVTPAALAELGVHRYLPGKQLALFAWRPPAMPDPATLRCTSMVRTRDGRLIPELARFAVLPWNDAIARVGKNLARVLTALAPSPLGRGPG